jgi:hypothetical protein
VGGWGGGQTSGYGYPRSTGPIVWYTRAQLPPLPCLFLPSNRRTTRTTHTVRRIAHLTHSLTHSITHPPTHQHQKGEGPLRRVGPQQPPQQSRWREGQQEQQQPMRCLHGAFQQPPPQRRGAWHGWLVLEGGCVCASGCVRVSDRRCSGVEVWNACSAAAGPKQARSGRFDTVNVPVPAASAVVVVVCAFRVIDFEID